MPETRAFFLCFWHQHDKIGINRESEYSILFRYRNSGDLVLYNRLLQCYVVIDIKVGEMKHQDLGQLQMYVHYFDRYVIKEFEKPTIGILLCGKKHDNIVELTLPLDSNIYASEYNLYLPDKATLQHKLAEWIEEFEEAQALHELSNGGAGE